MIPVDFSEQVIEGPMKERLQAYLASPTRTYNVMHIAKTMHEEPAQAHWH